LADSLAENSAYFCSFFAKLPATLSILLFNAYYIFYILYTLARQPHSKTSN